MFFCTHNHLIFRVVLLYLHKKRRRNCNLRKKDEVLLSECFKTVIDNSSRLVLVVGAGGAGGGFAGFGGLGELLGHRFVALGELLDGEGVGLVVRQAEVVFGADQGVLDLLQVRDGLVDFVDGGLELLAGQTVIAAEGLLEGIQLAFEMGHVHALAAGDLQFFLDADRLLGGIDQEGDDRAEELRAIGDIDNAAVV